MSKNPTTKTLWGLAKSPELRMTDEELHLFVQAYTGKESIRKLTDRELENVIQALRKLKGGTTADRKRKSGNPATENQRKKIYCLTKELGWEKAARVDGLCKKMFGVETLQWLNYQQCSKLIEALKSMCERV